MRLEAVVWWCPIEAGHLLRGDRGPGSYEAAVRQQTETRKIKAILEAASRPPVPGEPPEITEIRDLLAQATPSPAERHKPSRCSNCS